MHTTIAKIAALDLRRKRYDMTQIITKNKSAFIFFDLLTIRLMNAKGTTQTKYSEAKFRIPSVEPGLVLMLRLRKL